MLNGAARESTIWGKGAVAKWPPIWDIKVCVFSSKGISTIVNKPAAQDAKMRRIKSQSHTMLLPKNIDRY